MENKEPAFLPEEHALVYHDQSFQGTPTEADLNQSRFVPHDPSLHGTIPFKGLTVAD